MSWLRHDHGVHETEAEAQGAAEQSAKGYCKVKPGEAYSNLVLLKVMFYFGPYFKGPFGKYSLDFFGFSVLFKQIQGKDEVWISQCKLKPSAGKCNKVEQCHWVD